MYIYIYIYIYACVYIYIYIYDTTNNSIRGAHADRRLPFSAAKQLTMIINITSTSTTIIIIIIIILIIIIIIISPVGGAPRGRPLAVPEREPLGLVPDAEGP